MTAWSNGVTLTYRASARLDPSTRYWVRIWHYSTDANVAPELIESRSDYESGKSRWTIDNAAKDCVRL